MALTQYLLTCFLYGFTLGVFAKVANLGLVMVLLLALGGTQLIRLVFFKGL